MRIDGIPKQDTLLNLTEAADLLRISLRTLHHLLAAGDAPPVFRIGRRRLIRRAAIEQWLTDREGAGHDAAA